MTCPIHGSQLMGGVCVRCEDKKRFRQQQKVAATDVRRTLSERDVEEEVVAILQAIGCRILKNTVHIRSKNPKHHRTGQTPGVPDISCRKDSWPKGVWLGLELKKPHGGVLSPEQAELLRSGGIYVVKSAEEAMAAFVETDGLMRRLL